MADSYGKCLVVAAGAVPLSVYLIRKWAQGGQFTKDVRIDGKVVVITGANTGIGKETALELAHRGGKIYMACRDMKKAEEARLEIIEKTGNTNVFCRSLDLSSFDSIREFADGKEEDFLHLLINNAGVMAMPKAKTRDGLEMQMGVNYFGHFLLTNLILEQIKAAAPSRIINVSSHAHKFGKINRDDLNSEKSYSRWGAYSQSKLANILFTRKLMRNLMCSGVVVNSVHPGAVSTDLSRHMGFEKYIFGLFRPLFFKTPKSGAQTTLMVALDPDLATAGGGYFSDCKLARESKAAQCEDTASWLWKESEKITNLHEEMCRALDMPMNLV